MNKINQFLEFTGFTITEAIQYFKVLIRHPSFTNSEFELLYFKSKF